MAELERKCRKCRHWDLPTYEDPCAACFPHLSSPNFSPCETVVEVDDNCPFCHEPCADEICTVDSGMCKGLDHPDCPLRRGPVTVKLKEGV